MGFGSNEKPCAQEYMACLQQQDVDPAQCIEDAYPGQGYIENLNAFPANCNYVEAAIGRTWVRFAVFTIRCPPLQCLGTRDLAGTDSRCDAGHGRRRT